MEQGVGHAEKEEEENSSQGNNNTNRVQALYIRRTDYQLDFY